MQEVINLFVMSLSDADPHPAETGLGGSGSFDSLGGTGEGWEGALIEKG